METEDESSTVAPPESSDASGIVTRSHRESSLLPGIAGIIVDRSASVGRRGRIPFQGPTPAMQSRLDQLNSIFSRFNSRGARRPNVPSLSINALQPELLAVANELQAFQSQIERGAIIIGQELDRLDEQALLLDQTSQKMQAALAQEVA